MLLLLQGCARRADPSRAGPPPSAPVSLEVENQNFHDMVIFLETGNQRIRLVSVVGGNSVSTEVAPGPFAAGPIRLVAEPVGPREFYRSEWVTVSAGDRVLFRVGPQLLFSTVILR